MIANAGQAIKFFLLILPHKFICLEWKDFILFLCPIQGRCEPSKRKILKRLHSNILCLCLERYWPSSKAISYGYYPLLVSGANISACQGTSISDLSHKTLPTNFPSLFRLIVLSMSPVLYKILQFEKMCRNHAWISLIWCCQWKSGKPRHDYVPYIFLSALPVILLRWPQLIILAL